MPKRKKADAKRERLAKAAVELAYRQGFGRTTLADIAAEADVPLGNIYYYYKTRDDIGEAIVRHREGEFEALRAHLDTLPSPKARLLAFIDMTARNAATVAERGCPMGSLCAELLKDGGPLAARSNAIFAGPMEWMSRQFSALGCGDSAPDLAVQLQASLQGASLLTQSFRDPTLLEREGRRLKAWIEGL